MAKKSIAREAKRSKLVKQFRAKRESLKQTISSEESSFEDKMEAVTALARLPRDSSKARQRNRCRVTGRPHGYCQLVRST